MGLSTEGVSASVIIPTFNGEKRIAGCLESLQKQTSTRKFEIVVVNDGSTDNTAEVVERFPTVRLISQANAGPATARNRGARETLADVILFTDDDCEPTPE